MFPTTLSKSKNLRWVYFVPIILLFGSCFCCSFKKKDPWDETLAFWIQIQEVRKTIRLPIWGRKVPLQGRAVQLWGGMC